MSGNKNLTTKRDRAAEKLTAGHLPGDDTRPPLAGKTQTELAAPNN